METALKSNEWLRNCVHQTFKIEIQKGGDQIMQLFFRSAWFLPRNQSLLIEAIELFFEIGFARDPWKLDPILNLRQLQKSGEK